MHRLLKPLPNHLLAALPASDQDLLSRSLIDVDLERGRVLYEPGDRMDTLYFPHDGVISLMTLMENGAAIENATIGSLKRESEDVREVRAGFECGIGVNGFEEFVPGDVIECVITERVS